MVHLAASSCVIPGTLGENMRFLAHRVPEVGLCLFEARSCLEYGIADLPGDLADLPLKTHVHLPVDLPWEAGGAAAAALALAVLGKVHYLRPRLAVLHPPDAAFGTLGERATLVEAFMEMWRRYADLPVLLENIAGCPLTDMTEIILRQGLGICLDLGHFLGYHQDTWTTAPELLRCVQLVHWSAPGRQDQHLPLSALTPDQKTRIRQLVPLLPSGITHLVEVFHWNGVEASLPVLTELLRE